MQSRSRVSKGAITAKSYQHNLQAVVAANIQRHDFLLVFSLPLWHNGSSILWRNDESLRHGGECSVDIVHLLHRFVKMPVTRD